MNSSVQGLVDYFQLKDPYAVSIEGREVHFEWGDRSADGVVTRIEFNAATDTVAIEVDEHRDHSEKRFEIVWDRRPVMGTPPLVCAMGDDGRTPLGDLTRIELEGVDA